MFVSQINNCHFNIIDNVGQKYKREPGVVESCLVIDRIVSAC